MNKIIIKDLIPWSSDRKMGPANINLFSKEVILLFGSVGSGKSDLLQCFIGVKIPTNGSIKLNGIELVGSKPHEISNLGVSYMPQEQALFNDLTVNENLLLSWELSLQKNEKNWNNKKNELIKIAPLVEPLLEKKAGVLSGGQQRIIGILRVWIANPILAIFDEPANGLDSENKKWFKKIISYLKNNGSIIIIAEQTDHQLYFNPDQSILLCSGRSPVIRDCRIE